MYRGTGIKKKKVQAPKRPICKSFESIQASLISKRLPLHKASPQKLGKVAIILNMQLKKQITRYTKKQGNIAYSNDQNKSLDSKP